MRKFKIFHWLRIGLCFRKNFLNGLKKNLDKYFVVENSSKENIWWGEVNQKVEKQKKEQKLIALRQRIINFFFIDISSKEKINTNKSCSRPAIAKKYDRLISSNPFKYPPTIAKIKPIKIKKGSEKYQLSFFGLKKNFINLGKKII